MHWRRNQRIWQYFRHHRVASIAAGHLIVVSILATILVGNAFGSDILGVFARTPCSSGNQTYRVVSGDTLGAIAGRFGTTWQRLAAYNRIANPNLIYIDQHVCIPGRASGGSSYGGNRGLPVTITRGEYNPYPYGQCTWWANQRFYQMHGVFVPWTYNANAWQWTQRAYEYGWRVSSSPSPGAIVDLQPWVQGAYDLGHVAVVERVLGNGDVIASNMNWGGYPWQVSNVEFTPGPGVTFISY